MDEFNVEDIQKLYALKYLIDHAKAKYQDLSQKNDETFQQSVSDLLTIISDSADKLCMLRWIDTATLGIGTEIYRKAIDNL